jgi:AraC family transcriptional regulator
MPEPKLKHELTPRIEPREAMLLAESQQHYTEQSVADIPAQWSKLPFGKIPSQADRTAYGVTLNAAPDGCDVDYSCWSQDFPRSKVFPRISRAFRFQRAGSRSSRTTITSRESKARFRPSSPTGSLLPATLRTPGPAEPQMIEFYGEDFNPQTGDGTIELWLPLKA